MYNYEDVYFLPFYSSPERVPSDPTVEHSVVGERSIGERRFSYPVVRGLLGWGSLAATGLASVLGTVAANTPENVPPRPAVTIFDSQTPIGGNTIVVGGHDAIPGAAVLRLPGVILETYNNGGHSNVSTKENVLIPNKVEKTRSYSDRYRAQLMKWARLFDKDSSAKETLDKELGITKTIESIREMVKQGKDINRIGVHGYASDEDDTAWRNGGNNPGFGVKDEKNVRLAEVRAVAVADILRDRIKNEFGEDLANKVVVTGGTEIQDAALAKAITDLAERKGMTAHQLVVMYNRDPNKLSKDDLKILNGLRDDRYVGIDVDGVKKEVITTYKKGTKIVVKEVPNDKSGWTFVLIPIIIPRLGLRQFESSGRTKSSGPQGGGSSGPEGSYYRGLAEEALVGSTKTSEFPHVSLGYVSLAELTAATLDAANRPPVSLPDKRVNTIATTATSRQPSHPSSYKQPGMLSDGGNNGTRGQSGEGAYPLSVSRNRRHSKHSRGGTKRRR